MKNIEKIKKISLGFICLFLALNPIFHVRAAEQVDVYLFYGEGCPHCAKEEELLSQLEKDNLIKTHRFEIWHNTENAKYLKDLSDFYHWQVQGVPFTIVGNKTFSGYLNAETSGNNIISAINNCQEEACHNLIREYKDKVNKQAAVNNKQVEAMDEIVLPVFGKISVKSFSLPLLTVFIAALDGFNPCALWILLFLISLLIGMQDRKKMFILGSAFILTSAIFYFFVLAAWLNMVLFIGFVAWLRLLIAFVALYAGYKNIKEYWLNRKKSCEVIDENKRKKIFSRAKEIIGREKIWLASIGIILLALSVNMFELICSAGLPAVFTQILASSKLNNLSYYLYILFYVFIFVLNQIIIFGIALFTFKIQAINPKLIQWFNFIGGVIMLILGILLIFKPNWLMFG